MPLHVHLTQIQRNFLTTFCINRGRLFIYLNDTTLQCARIIADDEIYRLHNTTTPPRAPVYAGSLLIFNQQALIFMSLCSLFVTTIYLKTESRASLFFLTSHYLDTVQAHVAV